MKDIKTKQGERKPRVLPKAARRPKELVRRKSISAREKLRETAEESGETPVEYAQNHVERTAEQMAGRVGEKLKGGGQKLERKAKEKVRERWEKNTGAEQRGTRSSPIREQTGQQRTQSMEGGKGPIMEEGTKNGRTVTENRRPVKEQYKGQHGAKPVQQSGERTIRQSGKRAARRSANSTVKTARKGVKTVKRTVKSGKTAVKTAQRTVKAARKAGQAAAKGARLAAKAGQAAARAAVTGAKVAIKVTAAIVKAIAAAVKALIAAIAAGGWVAVVAIVVIAVLAFVVGSAFGLFSANDTAEGQPMTEAVSAIDEELQSSIQERIRQLTASTNADATEVSYEGDRESSVENWQDVLAVYAVKTSMDREQPADVLTVTEANRAKLREVFFAMNPVSYRTETKREDVPILDESGEAVMDEAGNPRTKPFVTLYIHVQVDSMDGETGADMYNLDHSQRDMLEEMLRPEYYPLYAPLLGDTLGDGGELGPGLDIHPDLPDNALGAQIVTAAKKYIGRSYASMDCSGLVREALRDCGISTMNGLTSTGMAQKCRDMEILFTDPSQLQAGDLIFFARKDAKRGAGYCTDTRRCGAGKCKRWLQIHHVAIYINSEYLIDSTGGKNSVQIRKHWGKNNSEWEWVCFGRAAG